jgi:hypothetical protein
MVWYAVRELHPGKVRMKNRLGFIKTTLAGGIVILIPAVVKRLATSLQDRRSELHK